ncbi:MAG: endonuclease NucS [Porticoccaceae bacterium]|nr:endonuclease NucS [Porticoccaceae bacterium]
MRNDFPIWLEQRLPEKSTQSARLSGVKKIEEVYGDLEENFSNGKLREIIESLTYTSNDERLGKSNPSKILISGNIRNGLATYKSALNLYLEFLENTGESSIENRNFSNIGNIEAIAKENNLIQQRFTLERDMQAALRHNISLLDSKLRIIDDGAERAVDSGLIDITCEDSEGIVVIELKAGKADSRAIGQILGYMGDLQEEESTKQVRGILIAHDFDRRAKAAARVVPTLKLMTYSIEFKFTENS